jgi:hypothetical protein
VKKKEKEDLERYEIELNNLKSLQIDPLEKQLVELDAELSNMITIKMTTSNDTEE